MSAQYESIKAGIFAPTFEYISFTSLLTHRSKIYTFSFLFVLIYLYFNGQFLYLSDQ